MVNEIFTDPADLPEQIEAALQLPLGDVPKKPKVCICGVGASAMAGEIMSDFADVSSGVPISVIRTTELPRWVDSDTAMIAMSYGGDTPEILSLYDEASSRGCDIICITSGGMLSERARSDGNLLIEMPPGLMTRGALGYMLGFTASLFEEMGICASKTELNSLLPSLRAFRDSLADDKDGNEAKKVSKMISGRIPVIYSPPNMRAAAIRWKMQINENSKTMAFYGTIPEFNHNEIVGWTEDRASDEFIPIILCDEDSVYVLKCMTETLSGVLQSSGIRPYEFKAKGSNDMEKNLMSIIMGDFVSVYLAHLKGVYPGEVQLKHTNGSREFD